MNTIYVLIFLCSKSYGAATNAIEFSSKDKCEMVGTTISKEWSGWTSDCAFICVEK